jgi:hypothetical protein
MFNVDRPLETYSFTLNRKLLSIQLKVLNVCF